MTKLGPIIVQDADASRADDGCDGLAVTTAHLDVDYYESANPDVRDRGVDPVRHYHQYGWRERRRPNAWFDTGWYLDAYPDVCSAGQNPLWHYVVAGRSEGRLPQSPAGFRRAIVANVVPPTQRNFGFQSSSGEGPLADVELDWLLGEACAGARGLVLAASHDRYIDNAGGIQIFLADEQRLFNGDRFAYLHVSSAVSRLAFAPNDAAPYWVQIVLDGTFVGNATSSALALALERLDRRVAPVRVFALHSTFGHTACGLASLARGLRPRASFAWIHDYATVCESPNLLRNDIAFCHAPSASSMACRVCIYGDTRPRHLAELQSLFSAVPFRVLSPSAAALDVWRRGSDLPYLNAVVHPHCGLHADRDAVPSRDRPPRDGLPRPVNVAFVGHPVAQKGWPLFQEIVSRTRAQGTYRFFHFAGATDLPRMDGLSQVTVRVTGADRFAMVRALAAHRIDLVAALSPWPETFSYITHEAFAAGADVVALCHSGNIADAIHRHARGATLADEAAVIAFFAGGDAAQYALGRSNVLGELLFCGTTATVNPSTETAGETACLFTTDPDLHVVTGTTAIAPLVASETYRFDLPADCGLIRLVCRSFVPAATQRASSDQRRLGVAIGRLALDDCPVPPGDRRRRSGWHAAETDGSTWTDRRAMLDATGASRLEIVLTGKGNYVRSPLSALAE
jgi:hypothetical protein